MSSIVVVGLGPAGLDRVPSDTLAMLEDEARTVVVRTLQHPAAAELAEKRGVIGCDDLYERAADLADVYPAIADRVVEAAHQGPTLYAVPGSPSVGEASVEALHRRAAADGLEVDVVAAESFLMLAIDRCGVDPLGRGFQVLDGRGLPDPLLLHLPTLIGQVDTRAVLEGVKDQLMRTLPDDTLVRVLSDLGAGSESIEDLALGRLQEAEPGPRVSLFLDPTPSGWPGLIQTNRRLRSDCPWDRAQTHHSLVPHLIEESYELAATLEALPAAAPAGDVDQVAYEAVEEELGDLLLQVVFHATLAAEAAGFGIEEVAEMVRRKLVRRHPHVFGQSEAGDADAVLASWDRLKADEQGKGSLMDGVPAALPALLQADKVQRRAAAVGFDWPEPDGALSKISEEADELSVVLEDLDRADEEVGDLLFSVVNVARRIGIDAETSLRRAARRFGERFRVMEAQGPLDGLTLEEMDRRWEEAKAAEA